MIRALLVLVVVSGCTYYPAGKPLAPYSWRPDKSRRPAQAVAECRAIFPGDLEALSEWGPDLRGHVYTEERRTAAVVCAKHGGTHMVSLGHAEAGADCESRPMVLGQRSQTRCRTAYSAREGWRVFSVPRDSLSALPRHLAPKPLAPAR